MHTHLPGMREGISVEVSATDRARLEAVVADRNSPQKHVWRARIPNLNHPEISSRRARPSWSALSSEFPKMRTAV